MTFYDFTCVVWLAVLWLLFVGAMIPIAPFFEWGCYLAMLNLALSLLFLHD